MHLRRCLLFLFLALGPPIMAQQVVTGTITGTGCVSLDVTGSGTVGISITGSWSGTIQPQVAIGGDAAQNAQVTPYNSNTAQSTITANGTYSASVVGATLFQVCGATVTNTATVKLTATRLAANRNAGTGNGNVTGSGITSASLGKPIIGNGTANGITAGSISIDASVFTGSNSNDLCDKIRAVISGLATPTTVTIYEFQSGAQNCAVSPYVDLVGTGMAPNVTGNVYLGNSIISSDVGWISPNFKTYGLGPSVGPNNVGTYLKASANFKATYTTGTCTNTAATGGTGVTYQIAVTCSGTAFLTNVKLGEEYVTCTSTITGSACGGTPGVQASGTITAVIDDTHLTVITNRAAAANASGVNYVIYGILYKIGDEAGDTAQPQNFQAGLYDIELDCSGRSGCTTLANYSSSNLSTFNNVVLHPQNVGVDIESAQAQNSTMGAFWVIGSTGQCNANTRGMVIRTSTATVINVGDLSSSLTQCNAGAGVLFNVVLDAPMKISGIHTLTQSGINTGVDVAFGLAPACPVICIAPPSSISGGALDDVNCAGFSLTCVAVAASVNVHIGTIRTASTSVTNTFTDSTTSCTIDRVTEPTLNYWNYNMGAFVNSSSQITGCRTTTTFGVQNTTQGVATYAGSAASPGALTLCIAGATCNGTTLAPGANAGAITVNLPTLNAANLVYTTVALGAGSLVLGQGLQRTQATNNLVSSDGAKITTYNSVATAGIGLDAVYAAVNNTAQTAAIGTTTLCAAATCGNGSAGSYRVTFNLWGSGTACSSVTAGKVTFLLTWTDENAVNHAAVAVQMTSQTGAATTATQDNMPFQTALANEGAGGNFTISTNGTIIQYATGYTACTTGTGAYALRAVVTRVQ